MDRFQAMKVFMRVVDANSFTGAAESLNLPRATVSTVIQSLESRLQVKLLHRTTRRLSLTPDGAAYYDHCVRILGEIEDTEAALRDVSRGPKGRLRVDVPASIGRLVLIPSLCEFHTRYPDIDLVIGMGDRQVDLVREAVDCVIRGGELVDSNLVARRIGSFSMVTCAAPTYLARHGAPKSLDDLQNHYAVHYFSARTGQTIDWEFIIDGVSRPVKMQGPVSVNDGEAYVACGLQGFGLIQSPHFMIHEHLESGRLVQVLPGLESPPVPISVAYLQNRHLSAKVRAFVEWVSELFGSCPYLGGADCETCCDDSANLGYNTLRKEIASFNEAEALP